MMEINILKRILGIKSPSKEMQKRVNKIIKIFKKGFKKGYKTTIEDLKRE